jgi:hypothetical protein
MMVFKNGEVAAFPMGFTISKRSLLQLDAGLLIVRFGFGVGIIAYHRRLRLLGGPERWTGGGRGHAMRHSMWCHTKASSGDFVV